MLSFFALCFIVHSYVTVKTDFFLDYFFHIHLCSPTVSHSSVLFSPFSTYQPPGHHPCVATNIVDNFNIFAEN